ncbi:MAG: ATP-binding protein, partial [Alphaproteobacteria bacterium]|nr:ATP-binding protein [Alphaproteobacteria bacterium]
KLNVLFAISYSGDESQLSHAVVTLSDITERKRVEDALQEAHEQLEQQVKDRTAELIQANTALRAENVERREAQQALEKSEQSLRMLLETTHAIPWVGDAKTFQFTYVGPQADELLGYPPDQWYDDNFWPNHIHPDDRHEALDFCRESLRRLDEFELEYRMIAADGRIVWIHDLVNVVRENGEPIVLQGFLMDITERRRALEDTRLLQEEIAHVSRVTTMGEFAASVAHELNQPLTNMRMMAENALAYIESADVDADVQTRKLEGVIGQVDRMAGIVDHMRLFSRKDSAERETFSPTACAADAIGMVENQYRALGIRLEKDLPARCRNVSGHRFKLEQVILNLLSNARDAAAARADRAAREGREFVPEVSVRVAEDRKTDTVILSVSDNGGGVPGDVLDEIFHPFFTTKAEGQGTGLGLSISYSIIDTMGGRIEVRNAEGGARFDVILPVADEAHPRLPAPKPQDHVPQEQPPVAADRRGRLVRVLVVDDEEPTARNTAEYLEYAGYAATIAGNGAEALKLFASDSFDVVVTDRGMPVMDGNEMIRRLRALDPNLPIIAMTGQGAFDDGQTASTAGNDGAAAAGASVVLRMPVRLRDLEGHVRRLTRA